MLFLGRIAPFINGVEHEIGRNNVGVDFGASLAVECARDVAQVVENVEAIEREGEMSVKDGALDVGIPHKVVSVEVAIAVAASGKDGEVGVEAELCRQWDACGDTIMIVPSGESNEVGAVASEVIVAHFGFCAKFPAVARIIEGEVVAEIGGPDGAQRVDSRANDIGHVDTVLIVHRCLVAP